MVKFKVAVVQFEIIQFKPEENLKKAENFIRQASGKADIIVFPEDFVTGPIAGRLEFADSENKYRKFFQSLAKKYKIDIVPGSIIEKDKLGFYNTSYYICSSGKIKSRYRKINLWHPEKQYLNPGNEVSVFNTKFGKIGLIICWDLIFPEIFRRTAKKGVNIVICPSYWTFEDASVGLKYDKDSDAKLVDAMCVGRVFENEIIMVYCNPAGNPILPKFKGKLLGHSQIAVPFRGAIKKLDHNKEVMFIQEIDTDILKDAERAYKIREDLKKRVF
ncbi:MAG: carbon-nitrogen hydrolase family protein [Candidatus Aenigmarchaeota archaeon]|nr:carbon-nitrogen hydrolase family protein [Candidatus Aenigmarchaeota archaeon]